MWPSLVHAFGEQLGGYMWPRLGDANQVYVCELWYGGLRSCGASHSDGGLLYRSHFLFQIHVISHRAVEKIMQPPVPSRGKMLCNFFGETLPPKELLKTILPIMTFFLKHFTWIFSIWLHGLVFQSSVYLAWGRNWLNWTLTFFVPHKKLRN